MVIYSDYRAYAAFSMWIFHLRFLSFIIWAVVLFLVTLWEESISRCCMALWRCGPRLLAVTIRQNIVSSFASSFLRRKSSLIFFRTYGLHYYIIAAPYLCLQWRRLRFGNGLQLMLHFVKIEYAVHKTYGGMSYKRLDTVKMRKSTNV